MKILKLTDKIWDVLPYAIVIKDKKLCVGGSISEEAAEENANFFNYRTNNKYKFEVIPMEDAVKNNYQNDPNFYKRLGIQHLKKKFSSRHLESFDNLKLIKDQLFDASDNVKQAFNDIVKYFTSIPRDVDNYIIWRSISIKDKQTGDSVTIYGDDGAYILQHEPDERQKAVLRKLNLTAKKIKIQVGPSEFKDYVIVNADPHRFGKNLKNLNSSQIEVHGVPDPRTLNELKKEGYDISQLKQFDDQNQKPKAIKYSDIEDKSEIDNLINNLDSVNKESIKKGFGYIYRVTKDNKDYYFTTNNGSLSLSRYNCIICKTADRSIISNSLRGYWNKEGYSYREVKSNEKPKPGFISFGIEGQEW